jgi:hypothetical protein
MRAKISGNRHHDYAKPLTLLLLKGAAVAIAFIELRLPPQANIDSAKREAALKELDGLPFRKALPTFA